MADSLDQNLWETDPERAALLAYQEVEQHWRDQVRRREYWGIPKFADVHHQCTARVAALEPDDEDDADRTRPSGVELAPCPPRLSPTPEDNSRVPERGSASWSVPESVAERFLALERS